MIFSMALKSANRGRTREGRCEGSHRLRFCTGDFTQFMADAVQGGRGPYPPIEDFRHVLAKSGSRTTSMARRKIFVTPG